ncbi:hypothetical protein N7533_003499 [Penicillium manginii]|uniref:uncharacterized protein n=1 Tax=Penicillium manginii TaxID=203109 RepID=UPI00254882A0|nr:uncharacterized protein N7533_003499 [Penicillium manginii]KAJ5761460.1 hypothetical protein N7533_003499 [Penicillium manginii]
MSLGISIGDIVLCAKIAHKLFSCVTTGRKEASKDLKELPDVLFSLCYTLHILRKEYETVITRVEKNEYLGYMIQSCQATLQELDTATAYYREIIDVGRTTKCFRSQAKIQWKRVLWSFRGDTFTKYRQKLQLHTDSLNLLLSTFIWSAASRIETSERANEQRLHHLLHQASQFSEDFRQSMQILHANINFTECRSILGSRVSICLSG